ncbi:hypothetical protein GCM10027521_29790 [Amycolatopsis cihanbeyliensis]
MSGNEARRNKPGAAGTDHSGGYVTDAGDPMPGRGPTGPWPNNTGVRNAGVSEEPASVKT